MSRDKSKDDKYFNCHQDYEVSYIAGLYAEILKVKQFLIKKCSDGTIKYMTHFQIYQLIEKELGYPVPR